ncbi:MAG: histidinol dehydrogenase [Cryomorphaceae bacterium]|nr:MAG: histidinol dehydrogenase [Cryomorphaceae bacterium]|tara:strand:- start:532 stop:1818 length:1287 start_codon:yes stop_codon:yes gene_type:complete
MNKVFNPEKNTWSSLAKRPLYSLDSVKGIVDEIFTNVKLKGDEALVDYTNKFDKVNLNDLLVSDKKINNSENDIDKDLKESINIAFNNIYKFHKNQAFNSKKTETTPGVFCWQEKRAIENVGLYIPGGTAPLFSSVLMLAIPAMIANCKNIVLCSPPNNNGELHPAILYCAKLCKVNKVICVGGAQSIAAMSIGTESVPKVNKIFGPGNQYVTYAKLKSINFNTAIDMPAGPSELLVLADQNANPEYIASDLLSQAEHGPDSQVIFVSLSKSLINDVEKCINDQIENLDRKDFINKSISNSKLIFFENKLEAVEFINQYAPEHYIINVENESFFIDKIVSAGSVFIGNYTPESAGDYASGTNHTLPTNGNAKQYSGVNLDSFLKTITFQKISKEGLLNISKTVETMADAEGLQAHKNAISIRVKDLNN